MKIGGHGIIALLLAVTVLDLHLSLQWLMRLPKPRILPQLNMVLGAS